MGLAVPCRSRVCAECNAKTRKKQESRVKGPWKQLLTLGLPKKEVSVRRAWERIHKWIRAFCHFIRDGLRMRRRWARVEGGGKLEYAWCIEAHKSGWPHVHIVHNLGYLKRGRAMRAWKRITGLRVKRIHQAVVRDQSGASRYLCKYIAKGGISPDVLVLVRWKKLVHSTLRKPKASASGWELLRMVDREKARDLLSGRSRELAELGYVADGWSDSVWARYRKSISSGLVVSVDECRAVRVVMLSRLVRRELPCRSKPWNLPVIGYGRVSCGSVVCQECRPD